MALQNRRIEAEKRLDRRTARLAAIIVNMSGKTSRQHYTEDYFMPGGKEPRQQSPEEMMVILMASSLRPVQVN